MILRKTNKGELFDCLYIEQYKQYGLIQGGEIIRFLYPKELDKLINTKYYIVEKSDIEIAYDKGLLTETKGLKLTEEDKTKVYESIFVDDEEFINSFLEDEVEDK